MNLRILQPFTLLIAFVVLDVAADEERQWPAAEWKSATPESQQVDRTVLDALDREFASGSHGNIDGMTVYRNGFLVYRKNYQVDYNRLFANQSQTPGQYNYHDPDWHPWFDHGDLHTIQSISKSVTSALIGIAIGRGEIPGVDVRIMPYFDGYKMADEDTRRDAITIRNLLTMTTPENTSSARWASIIFTGRKHRRVSSIRKAACI